MPFEITLDLGGKNSMVEHFLGKDAGTFGPEQIRLLSDVLAEAWQRVVAAGAKFNADEAEAQERLAKIIITLAKDGESDRKRLVENALVRFRL